MNRFEFKMLRESLHLSTRECAELLGWNPAGNMVRKIERGYCPCPDDAGEQLKSIRGSILDIAEVATANAIDLANKKQPNQIKLVVYMTDDELKYGQHDFYKQFKFASLHRAMLQIVADELGYEGYEIKYSDEVI